MKLSGEIRQQLAELAEGRDEYKYEGAKSLAEKTLACLVAPTAVGKSTIIGRILELAKEQGIDAAEVGTVTTRARRDNDPANYVTADEGITHELMIDQIIEDELVNWSLFETGHLYATNYESFPAKYNFLPCLPDSLPMLRRAGFGAVRTFYIVTTADAWHEQLKERSGPGFDKRLEEAMTSLEFSQTTDEMHKIESLTGDEALTSTAQRILNFTVDEPVENTPYGDFIEYVHDADFGRRCHEMYRLAILLKHEHEDTA